MGQGRVSGITIQMLVFKAYGIRAKLVLVSKKVYFGVWSDKSFLLLPVLKVCGGTDVVSGCLSYLEEELVIAWVGSMDLRSIVPENTQVGNLGSYPFLLVSQGSTSIVFK